MPKTAAALGDGPVFGGEIRHELIAFHSESDGISILVHARRAQFVPGQYKETEPEILLELKNPFIDWASVAVISRPSQKAQLLPI